MKKVTFSEYDEIFYIPNRFNQDKYLLSNNKKGIIKKIKNPIDILDMNRLYSKNMYKIGRFSIIVFIFYFLL